jgi:hypothetical protein
VIPAAIAGVRLIVVPSSLIGEEPTRVRDARTAYDPGRKLLLVTQMAVAGAGFEFSRTTRAVR